MTDLEQLTRLLLRVVGSLRFQGCLHCYNFFDPFLLFSTSTPTYEMTSMTIMTRWTGLNEPRGFRSCTPHYDGQQFQNFDLLFSYQFIQLAVCIVE